MDNYKVESVTLTLTDDSEGHYSQVLLEVNPPVPKDYDLTKIDQPCFELTLAILAALQAGVVSDNIPRTLQ